MLVGLDLVMGFTLELGKGVSSWNPHNFPNRNQLLGRVNSQVNAEEVTKNAYCFTPHYYVEKEDEMRSLNMLSRASKVLCKCQ